MRRLRVAVISGLAACLLLQAVPAVGSSGAYRQNDPEDSDSRLDVVLVKARATSSRLLLTMRTAEPWRSSYIEYEPTVGDTIMARLWWEFDTDGDGSSDIDGHFFWDNGKKRMFFEVYWGAGEEREQFTIPARKIDKRTVFVEMPLDHPEIQGGRIDLRAISVAKGVEDGTAYPVSGERDDASLGIVSIR